jgi:adenylosuccinate lyase
MPSHPLDFQLQAGFYATPELLAVFDERKMNRWLQVEAALARAQAELGIIRPRLPGRSPQRADLDHLDLELIKEGYRQSRNSLMPVIKALRAACRENYGQYVHYGATTQDILDTAQVLELEEFLQILYRDLRVMENLLIDMSRANTGIPR